MYGLNCAAACLAAVTLAGCAMQRAQTAASAQSSMVGMTKEAVLACMGVPAGRQAEGATEVWSYNSGDGRVTSFNSANAFTTGQAATTGNITAWGNRADFNSQTVGSANTNSFGWGMSRRYSCTVNVVMQEGRVSRVNYAGPTGPLLAQGEQCAYAVQNCTR